MIQEDAAGRLIVALDVPGNDEALALVRELDGVVSYYKVGLELTLAGGLRELITELARRRHRVFLDVKLPGDIPETIRRAVQAASALGVDLLTLSASADETTVRAARQGRGDAERPRLLFVTWLSSMDGGDFARAGGTGGFDAYVLDRCQRMKAAGCDGGIVSGPTIRLVREAHPDLLLVSPGVRPHGAAADDHKRSSTPGEAIAMGSDYLVVGRPITRASDPRGAAKAIIEDIGNALRG
jgi:orotidine-5'-phosphate decarboxylase